MMYETSRVTERNQVDEIRNARLREAVQRLVRAYQPQRIYLFGSAARGDADEESDYDLMVVVRDSAPAARRRSRIAYEALRGTGIAAAPRRHTLGGAARGRSAQETSTPARPRSSLRPRERRALDVAGRLYDALVALLPDEARP